MALGEKRNCPACAAKFYDLEKKPAICPKCAHSFDPEAPAKAKLPRKAKRVEELIAQNQDKADALLQKKKLIQNIDEVGDIDLSEFDDAEKVAITDSLDDFEEIGDMEVDAIGELEDRSVDDDRMSSDDVDEELDIEEIDGMVSLIDKVEDDEDDEDEDEK